MIAEGSDRYGRAFEHFILNEVRAYLTYTGNGLPLTFWRTSSGYEVDLFVGSMDLVIECKSTRELRVADLRGLRALREEHTSKRSLVVSRVENRRRTEDGIEVVPWREYWHELWAGELV